MRWLGYWAAVIAGAATSVSGCLTSQDNPGGGEGRLEDPPITIERGGSGGSGQGAEAGEPSGGTNSRGGRSGAGGGAGTSQGGSDAGCTSDRDCALRVDDRNRCYQTTGECVECTSTADCGGADCINNECRAETPCTMAEDCPIGLVCNPGTDVCVECLTSANCAADEICNGNACRKRCTSDNVCALFGLQCDRGRGYCVECTSDDDCAETRYCDSGQGICVRDICVADTASCDDTTNSITTCDESGSVLSSGVPCGTRTTCVEDGSQASCEPWVCERGTMGCSTTTERIVQCSDDGLEETVVEDCAAVDQLCVDSLDMCMDVVCEPSTRFCQGNTIQQCDSVGTSSSLYQTCTTAQYCNATVPTNPTCSALLCTPNMPACDGNVLTTCNAMGTGYTGARTDCTMTMQSCAPSGCTNATVDLIPSMPTLYGSTIASYTMLNFYSVTSNRTLTLIEQYMSPTASIALTWHVYESTSQTGTYTRLSPTPITTMSTTTVGYQSSGPVSIPLVAGRFYAIGIAWSTAVNFGYQQTTASQATSFGSLISAYINPGATPAATIAWAAQSSYWVPQRLTTSL